MILDMRAIGRACSCAGLLMLPLLAAAPAGATFAEELDRVWQDVNPVPRDQCRMFIVKAWPDKIHRGRTSPRDCLAHAIRSYRAGDHEEAFGWIQASVCPDRELQQAMVRSAPSVLEHLLTRYGPHVP
jgi:hypothetical protein